MNLHRRTLLQTGLALGMAPVFSRHALAADVDRFTLGLASGCPRPSSVVLWTRLMGEDLPEQVPVQWELASDEGFKQVVAKGAEIAEAAWGHSVHAEPAGLAPGRWYWYRFQAMGARSMVGRTRTAPAPDAVEPLRFATASCQRWDHGHYAAWRDMATQELDLVLFLGDYIYEVASSASPDLPRRHKGGAVRTLAEYRARYAQYKSDEHLQAMHARAPWICTWDDHEVENDYAAGQSQHLDPLFELRRIAATQAYWEHMPFPKALRPRGGTDIRIYERYDWGRLARLITLDDRQWRDPQACPKPGRGGGNTVHLKDCAQLLDPRRTLLGAQQEQWLAQSWDATRPWNLLAQQTLMARNSWEDPALSGGQYWTEAWDGYPLARQRLLQDMLNARARNPVVFGGDVHANYVADLKLDFDAAKAATIATEFCGTSITSRGLKQELLDAAQAWNPHLRYGRSDKRGYSRFVLSRDSLAAELRTVDDPLDAMSPVRSEKRFVVEAGRPGAQAV